jgi:hypothetical protein
VKTRFALLAVPLALALAGCGGEQIDAQKTEELLEHEMPSLLESSEGQQVAKQLGIKPKAPVAGVDCPSGQSIDVGATFSCEVHFKQGGTATVKLKIRNSDADLSTLGIKVGGGG